VAGTTVATIPMAVEALLGPYRVLGRLPVIRAGRLRHRVRIERVVETVNAVGGVTREWRSIAVGWGGVGGLSAREFMTHDQVNSTVSHRIMLRGSGLTISPKEPDRLRPPGVRNRVGDEP